MAVSIAARHRGGTTMAERYLEDLKAVNTDPVVAERIDRLEKQERSESERLQGATDPGKRR